MRSVHFDAADEDLLREMVEGLPGKFWKSLGRPLTIQEDRGVFDAAIQGESAESEGIVLNLAPGNYQIAHRKYHDETTLLYVTRLKRKQSRSRAASSPAATSGTDSRAAGRRKRTSS